MTAPLEKERKFFESHQTEWEKVHLGKFALVRGEELAGVFDDASTAVTEGAKRFEGSPYLVRRVGDRDGEVDVPALTLGVLQWQF
jgi:hypothetical protein